MKKKNKNIQITKSYNQKENDKINNNSFNNNKNENEKNLVTKTNDVLNLIPPKPKRIITYQPKIFKTPINYKVKYEKIRDNIDKIKKEIRNERIISNELIKENNILIKKENLYDELLKENEYLNNENKSIEKKIEENENKIKSQIIIINKYKTELNELIIKLNTSLKK